MRPEGTCAPVQENLWRYIDRELSAAALADMSAHLKTCQECNRLYEARARDAKLFRMAFVGSPFGEGFLERFHKRVGDGGLPSIAAAPVRGGARAAPSPRPIRWLPAFAQADPRKYLGRLAVAAALLSIASLVVWGLSDGSGLGALKTEGSLAMDRDGRPLASPAASLRPGDQFQLADGKSRLEMRLKDGSFLRVEGPARLRIEETSSGDGRFGLLMDQGVVTASVQHREPGRELRISSQSPQASAVVVGTELRFSVAPEKHAILEVTEGKVLFSGDPQETSVGVTPQTGPYQILMGQGKPRPVSVIEPAVVSPAGGQPPASAPEPPVPPPATPAPRTPAGGKPPPVTDLPVTRP